MAGVKPVRWEALGAVVCSLLLFQSRAYGADDSFSNLLAQAGRAELRQDVSAAAECYRRAEGSEQTNSEHLCLLARKFCELTYRTKSVTEQKELVSHALACSLQAANLTPSLAAAHACAAVSYAKRCTLAGIKEELACSRLLKLEAEKAIALDPRQDIAYYLLGRWNYGVANVNLFSRGFVKLVYGGLPNASTGQAISCFKKAIDLAPNRILYHAGLAMTYDATGQKDLAMAEWVRCRQLTPAGPEDQEAQQDAIRKLRLLQK